MRKIILTCFLLILSLFSYAQKNIEISVQQDLRLFLVGDQKGNDPLTTNILSKIEVPIYSIQENHIAAYASVEYADLIGRNYKRYAIGAGYVVKSIYKKIGAGMYLDYGKIYRQDHDFASFSLSGEVNFKINDKLKLVCTQQLTNRKDLKVLYNSTNEYVISGFVGLKFSL